MGGKENAHERKLGGNREARSKGERGRARERERVGEITRQFRKGERDHMNSVERVCVRKRWHVRAIVQERESMCKKVSVRT